MTTLPSSASRTVSGVSAARASREPVSSTRRAGSTLAGRHHDRARRRTARRWTASRRRGWPAPAGPSAGATSAVVTRAPVSVTASQDRRPSASITSGCSRTTPRRASAAEAASRATRVIEAALTRRTLSPASRPSRHGESADPTRRRCARSAKTACWIRQLAGWGGWGGVGQRRRARRRPRRNGLRGGCGTAPGARPLAERPVCSVPGWSSPNRRTARATALARPATRRRSGGRRPSLRAERAARGHRTTLARGHVPRLRVPGQPAVAVGRVRDRGAGRRRPRRPGPGTAR